MRSETSTDPRLRAAVNAALKLGRDGRYAEATASLASLARTHPESGAIRGVLGKLFYEAGDFAAAAKWFRQATRVSPESELASLGLYHSLWKSNRKRMALGEMSRFLSVAESAVYDDLLRGFAAAGILTFRREAVAAT